MVGKLIKRNCRVLGPRGGPGSPARWEEDGRRHEEGCKATVGTGDTVEERQAIVRRREEERDGQKREKKWPRGETERKNAEDGERGKQEVHEDPAKRATQNPKSWRARRRVRGTRTSPSPGHSCTKRCRANIYGVFREFARLLRALALLLHLWKQAVRVIVASARFMKLGIKLRWE
ncbi:hypothetical protein KM043_016729 [Ampulex compressa]|nr:hypothetical protein KM043_016729 [Ampulex compressa]